MPHDLTGFKICANNGMKPHGHSSQHLEASNEVVVAHPSELILALALRSCAKKQNKEAFMQRLVMQLK